MFLIFQRNRFNLYIELTLIIPIYRTIHNQIFGLNQKINRPEICRNT